MNKYDCACHKHEDWFVSENQCFDGCVNPYNCDPASHGDTRVIYTCECGAERKVNINQQFVEYGAWFKDGEPDDVDEVDAVYDDFD